MEEPGKQIAFPTLDQIVQVNRRMIEVSGGSFTPPANLHSRSSLEYVLTAISYPIYGRHLFDSTKDKACALAFEIIASHVFVDGNKRTAIHIAWEFLWSNGIPLILDHSVEDLAVAIARGDATRRDLLDWLHKHQAE